MTYDLLQTVSSTLDKSIEESNLPIGTLHRMALRYWRLDKEDLAETIERFSVHCNPELEFFRQIAQIPTSSQTGYLKKTQALFKKMMGMNNPMLREISFHSPFEMIEGMAVNGRDDLNYLSGPFFMAVAGDFSEDHDWYPENRGYLFSLAPNNPQIKTDELELRVLDNTQLKACITKEHGQGYHFKVSVHKKPNKQGGIEELFNAAVEDIAKYAFGPGSSLIARDAFKTAVANYNPDARITVLENAPLASGLVPFAIARPPSQQA